MPHFKGIPWDKLDLRYFICEVPSYANVAFIFNELGVNPSLHCGNKLYRLDHHEIVNHPANMSSCIRDSIGPIIEIVAQSLGHVDLVTANSLWDVSRIHGNFKDEHGKSKKALEAPL